MQTLYVFDDKNYNPEWEKFSREAVRAVIIKDGLIAMVKSNKNGFYKFPGGGIEQSESHTDALIRETLEETGLHIIPQSIKDLGMIQELRKDLYCDKIFDHKSYYYAEIENNISNQNLDEYEKDLEYELIWIDIKTAYDTDIEINKNFSGTFLIREAYILQYLLNNR